MSSEGEMATLLMPAEWADHDATWMGFPNAAYPGSGVSTEEAQQAWANVANQICDHEPVSMLCHPQQRGTAQRKLSGAITLVDYPLNDAWLRDSGPTFVIAGGQLSGVDWRFNGWGDNTQFDWHADNGIAAAICEIVGCNRHSSTLTNEGGGIHTDGEGLLLVTRTVQLDPDRNPGWCEAEVEQELHQQLGTHRAVWLPRGLYRDYEDNGTRGHVDMVACFAPGEQLLLHWQGNPDHPDHAVCAAIEATLREAGLDPRRLPAPATLRDNRDWVDYSYINHYVLNGAVIVPTFKDRQDDAALEQLAHYYPGRTIHGVDARVIFAMGGGVHCITQQQPSLPR